MLDSGPRHMETPAGVFRFSCSPMNNMLWKMLHHCCQRTPTKQHWLPLVMAEFLQSRRSLYMVLLYGVTVYVSCVCAAEHPPIGTLHRQVAVQSTPQYQVPLLV